MISDLRIGEALVLHAIAIERKYALNKAAVRSRHSQRRELGRFPRLHTARVRLRL